MDQAAPAATDGSSIRKPSPQPSRRELALSEGTGVSAATERLLVAGTRLGRLSRSPNGSW